MEARIKVDTSAVDALGKKAAKQIPFATAVAINQTVISGGSKLRRDFVSLVDRPTNYALGSIYPHENSRSYGSDSGANQWRATKQKLVGSFGLRDATNGITQKSGSYSPSEVFEHLFTGGIARLTRYEQAFRRIGLLGNNEEIVPAKNLPELNAYGNIPQSLIVRLLSYFQAFGEQGYRANSTTKTRARLAKVSGPTKRGKAKSPYVRINGVIYFYARGEDHLHRGIWAKSGTHGIKLRPIMLFVRRPIYRRMVDINRYAQEIPGEFAKNFPVAFDSAMSSAR